MQNDGDVIIVGAGIIGAACAYAFRLAGLKVIVVDAAYPGTGATGACMGHIVVMDDSEAQMQLTTHSRHRWEAISKLLSKDCEDSNIGSLWVAADDEELEAAQKKHEYYKSHGIETEIVSAMTMYELEPNLRPGLAGGLRVPGDRAVYATRCVAWFLQGVEVQSGVAVKRLGENCVELEGQKILYAKTILLACGANSISLLPEIKIEPRKGHLCITERYPNFCKHQIIELGYLKSAHSMSSQSVAFNIQPRPNGQLLIGSSREFDGWNPEINSALLLKMLLRASEYMPNLSSMQILRTWVGFRPCTQDKLPLIGAWPGRAGLYIAAGHEGLGISTSLGTADLLVAEILGTTPPFDPAPFFANRLVEKNQHE